MVSEIDNVNYTTPVKIQLKRRRKRDGNDGGETAESNELPWARQRIAVKNGANIGIAVDRIRTGETIEDRGDGACGIFVVEVRLKLNLDKLRAGEGGVPLPRGFFSFSRNGREYARARARDRGRRVKGKV